MDISNHLELAQIVYNKSHIIIVDKYISTLTANIGIRLRYNKVAAFAASIINISSARSFALVS